MSPGLTLAPLRRAKHQMWLASQDVRSIENSWRRRRSGPLARQLQLARAGFELPRISSCSGIWAVAMVRDESDVIAETVRHLLHQGVDRILVADNLSTDGTGQILEELAAASPQVLVARDLEPAYVQSAKMTVLADMAARAGAEWIVPFDADELWFGVEGTLAETLRESRAPIARASMFNAFPAMGPDAGWQVDDMPHFDDKIAFRPFPGAIVEMGNHEVSRPGRTESSLRVLHRPWRSVEQFRRKSRTGAAALALTDLPSDKGYHWRALGQLPDDELTDSWHALLAGQAPAEVAWRPRGALHPMGQEMPTSWDQVRALL